MKDLLRMWLPSLHKKTNMSSKYSGWNTPWYFSHTPPLKTEASSILSHLCTIFCDQLSCNSCYWSSVCTNWLQSDACILFVATDGAWVAWSVQYSRCKSLMLPPPLSLPSSSSSFQVQVRLVNCCARNVHHYWKSLSFIFLLLILAGLVLAMHIFSSCWWADKQALPLFNLIFFSKIGTFHTQILHRDTIHSSWFPWILTIEWSMHTRSKAPCTLFILFCHWV